ncbi:hypothetical protein [Microbacterium sp.]|uniref:hypothetical protein n=1 Tax=Microbacterium sp. TaxID=51671 RepID=UPI003A8EA0A2
MQLAGYNKYKKSVGVIVGAIFGAALTLNVIIDAFRGTLSTTPTDTWGQLLVLFIIAGAVSATVLGVRRHRRTRTAKATRTARDAEPVPERIQSRIAKLAGLKTLYDARATAGDQDAAAIASAIAALITDVPELFRRLRLKADRNERTNATIEYDNTLEKLSAALDRDYLLDVLANPRLWDAAPHRIRGVQAALDAVNKQVVRNIQQVNSRRSMVFEVALDGLTGSRKDMDDWQRDFDQASDDTG